MEEEEEETPGDDTPIEENENQGANTAGDEANSYDEDAEEEEEEREPPVKQKLYMLEFLVDDISLDFCNEKQLICFGEGKTIIEFKFLDIGPLRIVEDEFDPTKRRYLEGCTGTGFLKNGKSIIFGLTPEQAEEASQKIVLYCDFFKKTAKKEYKLGSCIIRLINMFKDLQEAVEEGGQPSYYKNIKDCYKIKSEQGELVGHVYAYIRITCFNEVIVNKVKKDPTAELDYTTEKPAYKYKYNRSNAKLVKEDNPCECEQNLNKENKICKCPDEFPHKTCPQIYTENKCIYDCPQTLRPCQDCPPICGANKTAKKYRAKDTNSNSSRQSTKSSKKSKGKKKK